ncbi:MAG TPA: serine/threonine-protein kinase [Bryobacteraceae bacterium]|nr:serine/threonine-protein kinase [Bryobacteraceae bacterium]
MPGMTILHYEFLEKLGAGAMGEVFKAHDKRLKRHVAIKALPYAMASDPERRRRFAQEALTASALNHPNIVTIHDVFHEGDTHFIVMEYVAGRTLLDSIPPTGMRVSQMLLCSAQMASALSAAHAAGIVHRDFKPANVMIGNSGLVKVLDFGLAKLLQPQSALTTDASGASVDSATLEVGAISTISGQQQTAEGSILGTVNYMAPEQAEGKRVDGRADIFALGAVMYEMLTGRRAFHRESDIGTLSAVLRDEPAPIATLVQNVPPELDDLVRGCLRKDPNARWQTMKEVELALVALKRRADKGEFSGRHSVVAVAGVKAKGRSIAMQLRAHRKKLLIASGAFAVLLLAASSTWFMVKSRSHVPAPQPAVAAVTPAAPAAAPAPTPAAPAPEPAPEITVAASPAVPPPPRPPAPPKSVPLVPPPTVTPAATPTLVVVPEPKPEPPPPAAPQPITVTVGDGVAFSIALAENVRNDADEGSEMTFRASEDVKVGDVLVIAKGATVKGAVVNGNGKRFLGMGGKMTFQLKSAETVDGQKIPVRASVTRRADGPTTRPVDTGRYAKPKDLAAARGTDYIAYIDGDHTVTLHRQ